VIANLLNTLLGIALVYGAVLSPAVLSRDASSLLVAGVGVIVLAAWARAADEVKWFNTTNLVLGAMLLILGAIRALTELHPLAVFWSVFWIGSIVAVFALWAALYNREAGLKRV
jgi:hypothetical protein